MRASGLEHCGLLGWVPGVSGGIFELPKCGSIFREWNNKRGLGSYSTNSRTLLENQSSGKGGFVCMGNPVRLDVLEKLLVLLPIGRREASPDVRTRTVL